MNEEEERLYFTEDFKLGPNYRTKYKTTLSKKCISYQKESFVKEIALDDVTGVRVSYSTKTGDESFVFLHIYSYPLKKKKLSKRRRRRRVEHVFRVGESEDHNENKAVADAWVNSIRWLLTKTAVKVEQGSPPKQKFLVFVNPFGGKGKALKLFQKKVKPMLDEAYVEYELKVTEYAGHAKEIARNLDVLELNGILFCSGDGLIFEVVNGLMSRTDWKSAIKIPLGHIPCGTGNGLCATSVYHSGEPFDIISSVFSILRGVPVPLDIVKVQTSNSEVHYSFLSVVFGIVADIDIESENYRYMGDTRFSFMAIKKIMNPQRFTGKIWYLPAEDEISSSYDEQITDSHQSGCDNAESVSHVSLKDEPLEHGVCENGVCENGVCENGVCENGIQNVYLPKMEESLPKTWKFIEGSFIGWMFVTLSHIGKDIHMVPTAQLGDGVVYGLYISGDSSRKSLLDIFGKVDTGEHVNVNSLHVIKARAFRIEPHGTSKILTIDGEQVHYGTAQGEVYKGMGRVFCLRSEPQG